MSPRKNLPPPPPPDGNRAQDASFSPPALGGWKLHAIPAAWMLAVLVLDHLTKWWAVVSISAAQPLTNHRMPTRMVDVIPNCLAFRYAENTGAAFSMFHEHPEWLALISFLISIAVFVWYWKTPSAWRVTRIGLALVLGGAIGNLIDRALRGYVVDFIHAYWRQYAWPTFNVADSAICIGVGLLILWGHREQSGSRSCQTS